MKLHQSLNDLLLFVMAQVSSDYKKQHLIILISVSYYKLTAIVHPNIKVAADIFCGLVA